MTGWGQAQRRLTEQGLPFAGEHFAPQEYQQYPQNWAVTQDRRGVVYIANNDGILEYDGESWRLISTLTNAFVRSLAVDSTGTIYVGLLGDFGYLKPDSVGVMRYESLYDEIDPGDRTFKDVWGTHATPDGIYFQAKERLFRWDGTTMKVWKSEEGFHTSFALQNQLYVREIGRGLLHMVDDSLRRVPGGEQFVHTPIHVMIPRSDGRILIGTQEDGLYLYDETAARPFVTEADPFLAEYKLYHGTALPGGKAALATLGGGVLVIDEEGHLLRVLDPAAELPDGVINYVHADARGGLWMALNSNGVAYADPVSPLTVYDERVGLKGLIYAIRRHQGDLYVATGSGLFVLEQEPLSLEVRQEGKRSSFHQISGVSIAWDMVSTKHGLLVATDGGVYSVRERGRLTEDKAYIIAVSEHRDGRIYVGTEEGLSILEFDEEGGWSQDKIEGIEEEIRSIREARNGTLWLGTIRGSVLRVQFDNGVEKAPRVSRFGPEDGLPEDFSFVSSIGDQIVALSGKGVFHVQEQSQIGSANTTKVRFVPDTTLLPRRSVEGRSLEALVEDSSDNVWMLVGSRAYIAKREDGSFVRREVKELRFPKEDPTPMYIDDDGVVWVGNGRELIRYDSRIEARPITEFQTLIRRIKALPNGKTVYGGAPRTGEAKGLGTDVQPEVTYHNNTLRIDVAAPVYSSPTPIKYQYQLEGKDSGWSEWQEQASVQYTNLAEGEYRFRVRARTARGVIGSEASFAFDVLPPWYRTWWAYFAYFGGTILIGLGYWRYYQIVQENKRAREQAKELARERMLNERLQEANEQLKQANELKDNFLANTSHELRTPLTTILGFTDVLKDEAPPHHQEFLDIIETSGQRLMRTLNALLDLAKLRSGVMEANLKKVDVVLRAQDVVDVFRHKVQEKGLDLHLEVPDTSIYAYLDDRYLERVLDNLVSNAVKFTEEGSVTVEVEGNDRQVHIHVRDTGVGIEEEFIPHLFEDFKQESSGMDRSHEGSGLGLAITARLVELMHGTIHVESTKGEGSTFTITFPRYEKRGNGRGEYHEEEAERQASEPEPSKVKQG